MTNEESELPIDREEGVELPTLKDRFFDGDPAGRRTWTSGWEREHDWYHHVTGYKDAADILIADLENGGRDTRKLGPPIMFLYRHHLELALKWLARECLKSLGRTDVVPTSHHLDDLWRLCLSLLTDVSRGSGAAEEVKQTTRLVDEFCRVDRTSEVFRYPENKDGQPSLPDGVEVDLDRVRDTVAKISLLLDCISTDLSARRGYAF
jgi:hypothetical protein